MRPCLSLCFKGQYRRAVHLKRENQRDERGHTSFLALLRLQRERRSSHLSCMQIPRDRRAAVVDDHVEGSARPWLILDAIDEALMQHAVAFNPIRIVVGSCQDFQKVYTADDADHQFVPNDRHPA